MKYINDRGIEVVEVFAKGERLVFHSSCSCDSILSTMLITFRNRNFTTAYLRDDDGRIEHPEKLLSSCVGDVRFVGFEDENIRAARRAKIAQSRRNSFWYFSSTARNTEINSGRKHLLFPTWLFKRTVGQNESAQLSKASRKNVIFAVGAEIIYIEKIVCYVDF